MQYIKFNGNANKPLAQLLNIDTNNQYYRLVQNKIYYKCDYHVSFEHTIVLPHPNGIPNHDKSFCTAPCPLSTSYQTHPTAILCDRQVLSTCFILDFCCSLESNWITQQVSTLNIIGGIISLGISFNHRACRKLCAKLWPPCQKIDPQTDLGCSQTWRSEAEILVLSSWHKCKDAI